MAVGTGAITRVRAMFELDVDCILATDDGMNTWTEGHWAVDAGFPILYVSHATAELPGMMRMAEYVEKTWPGLRAEYVPCGLPPGSAT